MSKVYDSLMKSGKFTAAQNKAETGEYIDCVSELVALCEEQGFIPRFYTDKPQDKVDRVLEDYKAYVHLLVTEETNLSSLIENAVKQIEADKAKEAQDNEDLDDDEADEAAIYGVENDRNTEVTDQDFADFRELEEKEEEADDAYLLSLIKQELKET